MMLTNSDCQNIAGNIDALRKKVADFALEAGRKPEDIKIVAVTKTVDFLRIRQAVDCGLKDLGENRVQELCDKYKQLGSDCRWHLIGHLQTNKVKFIIDKVELIHSLDRLELAEEIQKRAAAVGRTVDVLIQVNVAEENSKFGISISEAEEFARRVSQFPNIRVKGLMTIAPFAENPETVRWVFAELKKLSIDIAAKSIDNVSMNCLSMGMSGDFAQAIQEGANIVRVGSAIFGRR